MKRILTFLLMLGLHASLFASDPPGSLYEQSLLETIKEIQSLNHEQALNNTRDLIKQYPHSRLGHMLYADLLLAKAQPLTEIGSGIEIDRAMRDFRHEIKQRWQHDTDQGDADFTPSETLVTVEFRDLGGRTEVVLTHEFFPDINMRDQHSEGWAGCLEQLATFVEA